MAAVGHGRHILVVVLLYAALVHCSRVAQLGPAKDDSLLALAEQHAMSDQVLDIPKKANTELGLDDPAEAYTYLEIDGLSAAGNTVKVSRRKQCEDACNAKLTCKSFSFRKIDNKCVLSVEYFKYNPSWKYFARGMELDGTGKLKHSQKFHGFPGILVDGFSHRGYVPLDDCERDCGDDPRCKSFNFHDDEQICVMSGSSIQYDPDFKYYENEMRASPVADEDMETARERKKVLKSERLLANADKKARLKRAAEIEARKEAQKLVQIREEHLAAESAKKTKRKEKQTKTDKKRLVRLKADTKSALVQGEYLESVEKSKLNVQEIALKRSKEKKSKKKLRSARLNKLALKAVADNREAKNERTFKQKASLSMKIEGETNQRKTFLHLRSEAYELQAKATELAAEQRTFKPSFARRKQMKQEEMLLKEAAHERRKLRATNEKFEELTQKDAKKKGEFDKLAALREEITQEKKKNAKSEGEEALEAAKLKAKTKADQDKIKKLRRSKKP